MTAADGPQGSRPFAPTALVGDRVSRQADILAAVAAETAEIAEQAV